MNSCNHSGVSECDCFLRASLPSLSHLGDAGLGIEPSISCVDDVGVVGVDEIDGEEPVVKPGTTIGTCFSVLHCIRLPF